MTGLGSRHKDRIMGSGLGWVAVLLGWHRHPIKMNTNKEIKNMKKKQEAIEARDGLKCADCGETSSKNGRPFTATTLKMHRKKSHPGKAETVTDGPLVCKICGAAADRKGKAFQNQESLMRHQRAAHRGRATSPAPSTAAPRQQPLRLKPARRGGNGHIQLTGRPAAKYCPQCGCNLEVINAALSLTEGSAA